MTDPLPRAIKPHLWARLWGGCSVIIVQCAVFWSDHVVVVPSVAELAKYYGYGGVRYTATVLYCCRYSGDSFPTQSWSVSGAFIFSSVLNKANKVQKLKYYVKNQGKPGRKPELHHIIDPFCLKLNPKWWSPNHWLITGLNGLIRWCCENVLILLVCETIETRRWLPHNAARHQSPLGRLQARGSALCFVLRCLLHAWRQLMRQIRGIS